MLESYNSSNMFDKKRIWTCSLYRGQGRERQRETDRQTERNRDRDRDSKKGERVSNKKLPNLSSCCFRTCVEKLGSLL